MNDVEEEEEREEEGELNIEVIRITECHGWFHKCLCFIPAKIVSIFQNNFSSKNHVFPAIVAHFFNPSTLKAGAGRPLSLGQAWATQKTLSREYKHTKSRYNNSFKLLL